LSNKRSTLILNSHTKTSDNNSTSIPSVRIVRISFAVFTLDRGPVHNIVLDKTVSAHGAKLGLSTKQAQQCCVNFAIFYQSVTPINI